jgi:hypothetical protein
MIGGFDLDLRSIIEKFPELYELVCEMERNGITKSKEQSEALERDHGIKIPPYYLTELVYRESRKPYRQWP